MKIINNEGEIEQFKPKLIKNKIISETGLNEEEAEKIKKAVVKQIKKQFSEEVSTTTIRSLINAQLIKRGLLEEEIKSRKLGMSVADYEDLMKNGCKDNANMMHTPETVAKYTFDAVAKEYELTTMPKEFSQAHNEGYLHCLSANNNLIVKIDDVIQIVNIVDIVDSYNEIDYYVPSVNPKTEQISWKKIVDGACTGIKPVYELEFAKGYKIECTSDHKFIKAGKNGIANNYDICIDDFDKYKIIRLSSLNKIPYETDDKNYYESALYGFMLGDGNFRDNFINFHLKKQDKINYLENLLKNLDIKYKKSCYDDNTVNIWFRNIYPFKNKNTLPDFNLNYKGLLEGLINSDGYVTTHGGKKTNYLEFDSTNKFIADLFFVACLTFNIRPSYKQLKREYSDCYRLIVQNNFVNDLLKSINLREGHKNRMSKNYSVYKVYDLTALTPKKITSLGEQLVYNLTVEDNHNFMAGTQGFVLTQNCHDLETFSLKPNCLNHDIRWYGRNGLCIDGKGEMGAVASPAKSLKVIMNHMLQALMAGAQCMSGGQAFSHFNVFLAPYCRGLSYQEVKQEVQGFIYNLNMSCIAKGSQTIFSSINVEFEVPDFLKDEPAIGPGGVVDGVYGDYLEEADFLFRAVCEVLREKDAIGRYFTFPNTIYVIREHTLDEYDWKVQMVHELLSENPTIYFMNCRKENSIIMGCRTRLSANYTGDWQKDLLNTGNFHYCTVNLPLLALESEDLDDFYKKLKYYIDLSREILLYRKAKVLETFERGMSGFLLQPDKLTGEPLYNIDYATFSVGMCGLNECIMALEGKELIDDPELGEQIIKFMSDTVLSYKEKDGLRWSLFFTPAESTAHRFATIIKQKYPDAYVQGEEGNYYLTNSSHLPVHNDEASLVEHFKNADRFHKYASAGNIAHAWLGEAFPDPRALYSLNKKIAQTETKFWAFTNDYTYCRKCGYAIQLVYEKCPICDSTDVTVMSRITGYYQPVKMYNEGKKKEWQERYRHRL